MPAPPVRIRMVTSTMPGACVPAAAGGGRYVGAESAKPNLYRQGRSASGFRGDQIWSVHRQVLVSQFVISVTNRSTGSAALRRRQGSSTQGS
jgi:hypothetical protein